MCKYGVFSAPCFPVFGLNTEIYGVKYSGQIRENTDQKNSVFGHFTRSDETNFQHLVLAEDES